MTAATVTAPLRQEPIGTAPDVVHAFVASPQFADDQLCFSARDSGLWRSDDGGLSFDHVYAAPAPGRPVTATCLAFASDAASADGQTIFAGAAGVILRSHDGGRQWRAIELPPPAPLVTCLAISPAYEEDGVILAGTLEDGVLRSDDRGERWRRWNFGLLDLSVYCLAASPNYAANETLLAGTETALFRSENGGRSWRETAFPESAAPVLSLATDSDDTIWAGTERYGVWQSSDYGVTWVRADGGTVTGAVNQLVLAEHHILAVLPDTVLVTNEQGREWRPVLTDVAEGGEWPSGGIAALAAPWGIGSGATLLVQQRDGPVRRLRIGGNDVRREDQ